MNIKMICEEAIEEIRSCLGVNNIIEPYSDEMIAFGMAIEALNKQMPMKPKTEIYENRVPSEQEVKVCPCCGDTWNEYEFKLKYCWECGQAIDWSDIE